MKLRTGDSFCNLIQGISRVRELFMKELLDVKFDNFVKSLLRKCRIQARNLYNSKSVLLSNILENSLYGS